MARHFCDVALHCKQEAREEDEAIGKCNRCQNQDEIDAAANAKPMCNGRAKAGAKYDADCCNVKYQHECACNQRADEHEAGDCHDRE